MGVCFLEGDEVRCFREIDLALDEEKTEQIVDVISRNLHHLRKAFGLREDAKVFLGREDDGRFIGTVEILSKKARKAEPEIKSSTE